jgi:hypothetical protein
VLAVQLIPAEIPTFLCSSRSPVEDEWMPSLAVAARPNRTAPPLSDAMVRTTLVPTPFQSLRGELLWLEPPGLAGHLDQYGPARDYVYGPCAWSMGFSIEKQFINFCETSATLQQGLEL